jgi:serine/threonine protein kinase
VSVWKLAAGLVEALQAVHSCGLVHRDLKPANVLLALDGPRVIDFGISRALEKTAMTTTGLVVGTPSYMSPEQAQGARVGPPSDVFSLGCVIVFAATGRGPFGGGPQASMLYRVVHAEPALGEVPGGLRELAAACLAKAPADRPGLAALVEATAARRAPEEGDALASFWPVPVTGLIRSHQARLTTEMRERTAAPQPEPATTEPHTTEPHTTEPHTTGPHTSRAGGRRPGLRRQQRRPGVRAAHQRRQQGLGLPHRWPGGIDHRGGRRDRLLRQRAGLRAERAADLTPVT